ncbi:glutathione transferase GstA [Aestuariivirga litoralis]|uniref:Glutathione transferase GstA n=1 Tax=Aestuariivirga litoralis TaxID=2650924 RepID=A0A2W2ANU9_9HYPH|nr:glutathione transferase GstA [Aestuariivirga litoralis]PZF75252.1 glutathione transferase GstA [Aestuariivirga litoralis]
MKLYYSPGACSLAPHIVLNELGQPYDLEKVDLRAKKTETGADFTAINAKGQVPTLELAKGEVLTEVATILQYLSDKAKESNLLPAFGTMDRYRAMETLNFVASELHKGIGGLFNPAMPEDGKKAIIARVERSLGWLDKQLATKPYLLGDTYSVADAYAFVVLGWAKHVNVDLSPYAHIVAYIDRVGARPAVQAALKKEGLA